MLSSARVAGSASVRIDQPGGTNPAGVLTLGGGGGCGPSWQPTFGGPFTLGASVFALAVFDDGLGSGPSLYAGGDHMAVALADGRIRLWGPAGAA